MTGFQVSQKFHAPGAVEQCKPMCCFRAALLWQVTYCMCSVLCSWKGGHAVNAGKDGASTVVAVRVEFLLGKNIAASLENESQ